MAILAFNFPAKCYQLQPTLPTATLCKHTHVRMYFRWFYEHNYNVSRNAGRNSLVVECIVIRYENEINFRKYELQVFGMTLVVWTLKLFQVNRIDWFQPNQKCWISDLNCNATVCWFVAL